MDGQEILIKSVLLLFVLAILADACYGYLVKKLKQRVLR